MRFRRRKPDYEHIAEMERDIVSLPVPTLDERIEEAHEVTLAARRDPEWSPGSGIVLDPNVRPLEALAYHEDFSLRPGERWMVAEPDAVRHLHLTATSAYAAIQSRIVVATR